MAVAAVAGALVLMGALALELQDKALTDQKTYIQRAVMPVFAPVLGFTVTQTLTQLHSVQAGPLARVAALGVLLAEKMAESACNLQLLEAQHITRAVVQEKRLVGILVFRKAQQAAALVAMEVGAVMPGQVNPAWLF
tara:strand:- start:698 stop:1108 length:411 start_codon:yes stop_codon:yes gene_type:complete